MNWFSALTGGEHTLDAISMALVLAYGWAKEWQMLLSGILVLIAALVVARALHRAPRVSQKRSLDQTQLDLRLEPKPARLPDTNPPDLSGDLVGELEQLRSLIRSALSAFTLTAEKENSTVQFLCQRVARLRPDRFPLAAGTAKAQLELYAGLLEQMETLRQQLKKDAQPAEISGTLVQLNASARSLMTQLAPQSAILSAVRRQTASEQR